MLEGSLDGEGFQYYGDLPDRNLQSYNDLKKGLEQRFGRTVSSKARRAELHSMQQDPGEDLYKFSSCSAKVATKGVFKGGFRGFKPPPKFSDFFLKSEGKEIERKRKKRDVGGGGGGYHLTYFWG